MKILSDTISVFLDSNGTDTFADDVTGEVQFLLTDSEREEYIKTVEQDGIDEWLYSSAGYVDPDGLEYSHWQVEDLSGNILTVSIIEFE